VNTKQPCKSFFLAGEVVAFFLQFNHGFIESPVEEKSSAREPNDQKNGKANPSKPRSFLQPFETPIFIGEPLPKKINPSSDAFQYSYTG
jgi:hypothetical protein